MFDIKNRKGIIFGAAGGIGSVLSDHFARFGADLALVDFQEKAVTKVSNQIKAHGQRAIGATCDVNRVEDVDRVVAESVAFLGGLDFVINLAVKQKLNPIVQMSQEQFDETIHTSLGGGFLVSRAIGKILIDQGRGGSLVHFSSTAGASALGRGTGAYAAAKGGMNALVRELAVEWGPAGIRVNAIAPCQVKTPLLDSVLNNPNLEDRDTMLGRMLAKIPLGRLAEPIDLVGPCLFLVSEASAMVNGHVLYVDGGYMAQ